MHKRRTEVCKSFSTIHTSKYPKQSLRRINQNVLQRCTYYVSICVKECTLQELKHFILCYREIAELHKANAAKNSEAQQVALSAEMQAKEELRLALDRQQLQSKQDQEALVTQVSYLKHLCLQNHFY